jgi:CTP:molybdopterin cytidylyltransferase MocA
VIAAVVLAAGAASRFGRPKQQLLLDDVLDRVQAASVGEIVVVAGAHPIGTTRALVVSCPAWAQGPGASLRCGLAALGADVEAAVVVLADGPDLSPAAIERVVEHWRATGDPLVAASYDSARGHPLLVARTLWTDVPDEGLRVREQVVLVPCDDVGPPGDVDTPEDLPERFR